jgi:AraC-like DNA-binding protein
MMETVEKRDMIEVWRPHDLRQLEVRQGFSVARPVPRHWHDEYQLCCIQAGEGDLTYRGAKFLTPPASLFIVHPGEIHSNRAFDQRGVSYRMIFADAELMRGAAAEVSGRATGLPFFPAVVVFEQELVSKYLALHMALGQPTSSLERQVLLLDLLTTLISRFAENRPGAYSCSVEKQPVRRACDYLAEHYEENVSLETLARVANLSPFHFNRVFSEEKGMPPHAFQTQLRVARAKRLLREGRAISQVAAQTGFADQSHLTRHFKRLVAVTPGQYARNSKNVQD